MTPQTRPSSAPRMAGALYLAIAVCGGFSIGYVPQAIVVSGDAAATAANFAAKPVLFKAGVIADIAVIVLELILTAILYVLFAKASPILSATAMIARAGMITVMGINVLIWVMPLALPSDGAPSDGAHSDGATMMMFFQAHDLGVYVWQVFFGVHLLALGGLILRTGLAPRLLGWGLFIGALGYLLQGAAKLMFVDLMALNVAIIVLLTIVTLSELCFAIWLLVRGSQAFSRSIAP